MEILRCPACGLTTGVLGEMLIEAKPGYGLAFLPLGLRGSPRRKSGFRVCKVFRCCAVCGHLWGSLESNELLDFIRTEDEEPVRQYLSALEAGAARDLPDQSLAREAAARTAEIDLLVLEEKHPEATRRYRELTGVTWDEAIDTVRAWRDLGRAEKLALFGWRPKEPPGDPGHPLHDRELDG